MRLAIASLALVFVTSSLVLAEDYPRTAVIAEDRTPVRSGPGDDHYRTDELPRGAQIEVYKRNDGGWLAIRPLGSSYSWVAQREVELNEDRSAARVVGSSAVSWIGSNSDEIADHRWLVKLKLGEGLTVLGKERRKIVADGKSDLYYKIAPPSGEFRWVHEDDVVESAEILEEINRDPEVTLADFRVSLRDQKLPKALPPTAPQPAAADQPKTDNREQSKKDDFGSRGRSPALSRESTTPKSDRTSLSEKKSEPSVLQDSSIDSRIRELDARLSLLVAKPVERWSFGQLRTDAEEIAAESSSTLERARIQVFLDKVKDFEGLRSRHATFAPAESDAQSPGEGDEKKSKQDSTADGTAVPRFDGTGWLLPVHSTKRNAPPYALLDEDGNILQFVSPAPGLNLNRYLRKEVGIFGQKHPADMLDKPHLTAHRIVERDRHRK